MRVTLHPMRAEDAERAAPATPDGRLSSVEVPADAPLQAIVRPDAVALLDRHGRVVDPLMPVGLAAALAGVGEDATLSLFYVCADVLAGAHRDDAPRPTVVVELYNVHILETPPYRAVLAWLCDARGGDAVTSVIGTLRKDAARSELTVDGCAPIPVEEWVRGLPFMTSDSLQLHVARYDADGLLVLEDARDPAFKMVTFSTRVAAPPPLTPGRARNAAKQPVPPAESPPATLVARRRPGAPGAPSIQ